MAKKSTAENAAPSQELTVREKQELQAEEGTRQGVYFKPDVDIYETEDALMVLADVPGARPQDFEIDLRDNLLTITASTQAVEERWRPIYEEYRLGHYMRQFRLGQRIDQTAISAELIDGVLRLTLPKAEQARPRRIEIRTS